MTERTRLQLVQLWQRNERQLADVHELRTGVESPADAEDRLDREQDEIEADLATDWWQRRAMEMHAFRNAD